MANSTADGMVRQNLMERLLNSVKQVQVYFGASQEIATESDARVSALCVEWEMVLSHSARKPKPKNSLRLTGRSEGVSLWPLAKVCVSAEDLQRFNKLNHVTSELGRGRAWLRASINERTLENYMHTVLGQDEQLRKLYEPDAFLLDQERSSMLPIMAAGLSSIIFSISTDASYLNTPSRSVEVPAAPPPVETPPTQKPVSTGKPSYTSFPSHRLPSDSGSHYSYHPPQFSTSDLQDADDDDDRIAVSAKIKKKKQKKSKSKSAHIVEGQGSVLLPPPAETESLNVMGSSVEKLVPLKESNSSSSSRLSLDSVTDEGHVPMYVALTTPSNGLVSGEVVAAANATAFLLSVSSSKPPAATPDEQSAAAVSAENPRVHSASGSPRVQSPHLDECGETTSQPLSQNTSGSSEGEMRTAMLTLSKVKDDLVLENRDLRQGASELQERLQILHKELEKSRQEIAGAREAHASQRLVLERENDLLRDQLKKYVGMVQAQHKELPSASSSESLHSPVSGNVVASRVRSEASDGVEPACGQEKALSVEDKKFQAMAEMYSDVVELNERLHRNLADKDSTICALVASLREASIEVPFPLHQLPAAAMEPKMLVEVWIPSVIKKGRGPDGFHVYQVFVSVKGVEWNIYRRYTEFRHFHQQLQKHLPEVSTFSFPPKKAIGNKSSQVVEERRQKLQEYLRFVIECCSCSKGPGTAGKSRSEPYITHLVSKQKLVSILPFFKEDFHQDPNPSPQTPSYSGL